MNRPYERHDPPGAPAPLVLDSPHSGEDYPDDFHHAPPRSVVRQAEDTHVARLWCGALAAGATIVADVHELPPGDTFAMLRDPWGVPLQLVKRKTPMI